MTDDVRGSHHKPLNLNEEELDYLWEMVKREIGEEEVWERGDNEVVKSIHTKVHSLKGLDDG